MLIKNNRFGLYFCTFFSSKLLHFSAVVPKKSMIITLSAVHIQNNVLLKLNKYETS